MFNFSYRSDVTRFGYDDEDEVIGESFYIIAATDKGQVFVHNHRFDEFSEIPVNEDFEGAWIRNWDVDRHVDEFLEKIKEVNPVTLNCEYWTEVSPESRSDIYNEAVDWNQVVRY